MMILLRLWLILSLSAAAPLNPNVNNEVTEEDLVTDDIPNTNRDAKDVFYGGNIKFSGIIDSTGNHAHINIGSISSKGVSQEPNPAHDASEDPHSKPDVSRGIEVLPCEFNDDQLASDKLGQNASPHYLNSLYMWEKNIIPYYFTSTSDRDKQFFRSVMDIIEKKSCFIFQEETNLENGNEKHCLEIETGSESCATGCNGYVGHVVYHPNRLRLLSKTQVSDSENCKLQCQGFILHELMHVLGVAHTFTRSDRDDFISLNEPNIHSLKVENLLKKCENCRLYPEIPYDCDSIMHYGTHLNGIEVMKPKDADTCSLKKQAKLFDGPNLSYGDEKILNIIGKCPGIFNTKYIRAIQIMGNELRKLPEETGDLNLFSNEQKLEGNMTELTSYLQDECGNDIGSCELEEIARLTNKSVSTIEKIKETGKVSSAFLQTFELKKKILVEAAEEVLKKWIPTDCPEYAVNSESCICKGDGGEAPCHAGEKCNDNGTCQRVCTSGEINYEDCFCKSANSESGEECSANQGCSHEGTCLNVCKPYPEEELSDCLCENPWKETVTCTKGQVCKHGMCLNDEDTTRDPEFCKAVDCSLTGSEEFCPITCDQRQPAFCKVVDCSKPGSQEFCPIKCVPVCTASNYKILEADCVCKSKKGPEPCRKGKTCAEEGCMNETNHIIFLLLIG